MYIGLDPENKRGNMRREGITKCITVSMAIGLLALGQTYGAQGKGPFAEKASGQEEGGRVPQKPEVWLCPPGDKVFDLLSEEQKWDYSMNRLAGLKLYGRLFQQSKPDDLVHLAKFVKAHRLRIAVECGGTLNHDWQDQAGEKSAEVELRQLEPWYRAGGKVDYLDLDGPERRLLGFDGWGKDPNKRFVSIESCARQLAIYMKAVRKAHPEIQFFLLTNFPNWGYKGEVSYHGHGPQKQDWGDYAEVVKILLSVIESEGLSFAGATVDNPYEYAIGSYKSATLPDPSKINWIGRIRDYEEFCRTRKLGFNLIINSETGGRLSDKEFFERTLHMLDLYTQAGGRPTRYFVQSWYDYPKTIVPESSPFSMTALTKTVLERLEKMTVRAEPVAPADTDKLRR